MAGGKGKAVTGSKQILGGIGVSLGICFLLVCLGAWLLQKGSIKVENIIMLLSLSVFIASSIGCFAASMGRQGRRRIASAVPGIVLAMMFALGRWIGGIGHQNLTFGFLLTACALVPSLFTGMKRPKKRR